MPRVTVCVMGPSGMFCDLLQRNIAEQPDLELLCWEQEIDNLEETVAHLHPDVMVLDASLQGLNGFSTIRSVLKQHPSTRTLVVYDSTTMEVALGWLTAGSRGCISKQCGFENLVLALRSVAQGETLVPTDLLTILVERYRNLSEPNALPSDTRLSIRDKTMLALICQGASNRDIADRLALAHQTVKNYLPKLFRRLGVANRVQAAAWWRERELNPGKAADNRSDQRPSVS